MMFNIIVYKYFFFSCMKYNERETGYMEIYSFGNKVHQTLSCLNHFLIFGVQS